MNASAALENLIEEHAVADPGVVLQALEHPEADVPGVLDEFRLRTWARRHWVPADLRNSDWHPIILDEMSRRDHED